jgi:hypothetical protein
VKPSTFTLRVFHALILLDVVLIVLWLISSRTELVLVYQRSGIYQVRSCNGALEVGLAWGQSVSPPRSQLLFERRLHFGGRCDLPEEIGFRFPGFRVCYLGKTVLMGDAINMPHFELEMQYWLFIFPFLLVTALQGKRHARARLANAARCPKCGYDLRATPTRCPECGHSQSARQE